MELRELQWFITLAECEHVTAASQQLNISQPTLSRAVARLERQLGVRLFDRRQNRLHLNRYGEVLRAHALRAIGEVASAEQRITALLDPAAGTVALGFLHSLGGWLIPDLIRKYREAAPSTTFQLRGNAADVVVDEVRHRRLDIGVTSPRPAGEDVRWYPLLEERLNVLVPANHPLARRDSVAAAELAAESFVAFPRVFGVRQIFDRVCGEAGFTPDTVIEGTEIGTVRALVAAEAGIAIVPESRPGAAHHPGTVELALSDAKARREIGMLTAAGGPAAPAARRFLTFVTDTFHTRDA
ncbi:LysR family transcriptional regulator [Amycolatopsis sp. TRM77291]